MKDYQEYARALDFLEGMKTLAAAKGVPLSMMKELWGSRFYNSPPNRAVYAAVWGGIRPLRAEVREVRTEWARIKPPAMQARVEKAKVAFDWHLKHVRPSLARSRRSDPNAVSTHITLTPNAKEYVEVDVGPGGFVRFHISPAWALFPTWEESFPNDVLIYRERVGASPHHWRVVTGRFDPERYFVAKEQMLVIDPLTGALFLGLHITAATRKMQQARSAALMDAL